jgi:hypothetical protein
MGLIERMIHSLRPSSGARPRPGVLLAQRKDDI